MQVTSSDRLTAEITSNHQNKNLIFCLVKEGDMFHVAMGERYLEQGLSPHPSIQVDRLVTNLLYYIQQIGITKNWLLNSVYKFHDHSRP